MKHNKLDESEISLIKKLKNSRIPRIFKHKYIDFLLLVEVIHMFLAEDLLKQKNLDYYSCYVEEFNDFKKKLKVDEFDSESREYIYLLDSVIKIYNRLNSSIKK